MGALSVRSSWGKRGCGWSYRVGWFDRFNVRDLVFGQVGGLRIRAWRASGLRNVFKKL